MKKKILLVEKMADHIAAHLYIDIREAVKLLGEKETRSLIMQALKDEQKK